MSRVITIGDVHGCLEQLHNLLDQVAPRSGDQIIFIGDLIDKGPDSAGVVRVAMQLADKFDVVLVTGNHEEKFFRLLGKPDLAPEYIKELGAELTEGELAFLKSGVLYHRINPDLLVVHGGILPEHDTLPDDPTKLSKKERKSLAKLMRVRFVRGRDYEQREVRIYDASGARINTVKLEEDDPMIEIPEGCTHDIKINIKERGGFIPWKQERPDDIFWANLYDRRHGFVIFGHESFEHDTEPHQYLHAVGIDLGCVKGGRLAAAIYTEGEPGLEYASVPGLPADQAVLDDGE